jgi:chromosome partitioning protein
MGRMVEDKTGQKVVSGLGLVPTDFNFGDLEAEYRGDPERPHYLHLQEQLAAIEDEYDIIFSIVPEYFAGLAMRYFSSHEINVPSNPNALSLIGFTLLVDKLGKFH